jgi:regulator of sigma E protease
MLTVVAFIVALGLLITVHEYGHYRVAVACGVKVERFSIGFGKVLWRWRPQGSPTEFVVAAFPLGGYVKMLDEREGAVDPGERHRAFNTQTLGKRAAIVAAGPAANLLLAVLLYAMVNWTGVQEPQALLASPVPASLAEQAGVRGGERVTAAAFEGEALRPLRSFEDLRWLLARGALDARDVQLTLEADGASRDVRLPLAQIGAQEADAQVFRRIGIMSPWTQAVLGELVADGAGARSGLQPGDVVVAVGSTRIVDGPQLRETIRASVDGEVPRTQLWRVERDGQALEVPVTPQAQREGERWIGRIGAMVGAPPAMVVVRYGPLDGLWSGVVRTWEVSSLTLRMLGRMVVGEASLKNLSGPLTIADYAGKSASLGLTQYIVFLALISVSLGVLNLLPLPVLDGGHLMYYLWEAVTGKAVSDAWMERMQRTGVALLLVMMSIALFNDVTRIFG